MILSTMILYAALVRRRQNIDTKEITVKIPGSLESVPEQTLGRKALISIKKDRQTFNLFSRPSRIQSKHSLISRQLRFYHR